MTELKFLEGGSFGDVELKSIEGKQQVKRRPV